MLKFLAITEIESKKNRTAENTVTGKLTQKQSCVKKLFAICAIRKHLNRAVFFLKASIMSGSAMATPGVRGTMIGKFALSSDLMVQILLKTS